jgi:hypothetical protein
MTTKRTKTAHTAARANRRRPIARKIARAGSTPPGDSHTTSKPKLIGYARVSTVDQNLALQRDALTEAGCEKIFTEQMSGAVGDRPALHDALEFARRGDTLIVWKRADLARSSCRGLRSGCEPDAPHPQVFDGLDQLLHRARQPVKRFSHVWSTGGVRAQPDPGAHPSGPCRRAARGPHRRPSAETDGRRHRGRQGDAR